MVAIAKLTTTQIHYQRAYRTHPHVKACIAKIRGQTTKAEYIRRWRLGVVYDGKKMPFIQVYWEKRHVGDWPLPEYNDITQVFCQELAIEIIKAWKEHVIGNF